MTAGDVSPGLVIRIRGEAFTAGSRFDAPAGAALPVLLGAVRVLVNGSAAPLESVSPQEIQAIVPYAVAGGNAVAAWVSRVDEAAVRNTQDVDILLRRSDLSAAIAASVLVAGCTQPSAPAPQAKATRIAVATFA